MSAINYILKKYITIFFCVSIWVNVTACFESVHCESGLIIYVGIMLVQCAFPLIHSLKPCTLAVYFFSWNIISETNLIRLNDPFQVWNETVERPMPYRDNFTEMWKFTFCYLMECFVLFCLASYIFSLSNSLLPFLSPGFLKWIETSSLSKQRYGTWMENIKN